jgi:hypothetical protein
MKCELTNNELLAGQLLPRPKQLQACSYVISLSLRNVLLKFSPLFLSMLSNVKNQRYVIGKNAVAKTDHD